MIVRTLAIFFLVFASLGTPPIYAQPKECPDSKELIEVPIEDINKVADALHTIIPITYEVGEFPEYYTKWELVTVIPFPMTRGNKELEDYYKMASNFCGKEVADRSWLVRLHFPRVKGVSASQGQIFIAKKKDSGWLVWFKYH